MTVIWLSSASIVVGVPLGIAMARRAGVSAAVTPVLDVMQTMPSFAYLALLRASSASARPARVVLTIVYALPPLVRITEHGLRDGLRDAPWRRPARSGLTRRQLLRKVQLPMARRTIIVGVNQCTLAALSMVVIAAFVDGPGLGKDVLTGADQPRTSARRRCPAC